MKFNGNLLMRLCCYISLAITFMPVVDYYSPWYITMIPALLVFLLSFSANRDISSLVMAFMYITGLALLTMWYIQRNAAMTSFFAEFYIAFLPAMLAIQIRRVVQDEKFFHDYLYVTFLFVGITCITTLIGHAVYPMASRELASGTAVYDTEKYWKMNIGGYEFVYALVIGIPVLMWLIRRETGYRRTLYIVIMVLMVLCIYSSQYTLALIGTVIAFLIVWIKRNPRAGLIACTVLIAFLLIDGLSLLGQFFGWASETVKLPYVSDRLLQVSQLLSGETVETETSDARILIYQTEWNIFLNYPIWGANLMTYSKSAVSGHTYVLDMLAGGGVFATTILLALHRGLYRITVPIRKKKVCRMVNATWLITIIISVLNPVVFAQIAVMAYTCCMCVERIEKRTLFEREE